MKVKDLILACVNIQPGSITMIVANYGTEKYEDYQDILNDMELSEKEVLYFNVKSEMQTTYIYL